MQLFIDLAAALKWGNDIFGIYRGVPGNVNIFRQSEVCAKVNIIIAIPSSEVLFHEAINQVVLFRTEVVTSDDTRCAIKEIGAEAGLDEGGIA